MVRSSNFKVRGSHKIVRSEGLFRTVRRHKIHSGYKMVINIFIFTGIDLARKIFLPHCISTRGESLFQCKDRKPTCKWWRGAHGHLVVLNRAMPGLFSIFRSTPSSRLFLWLVGLRLTGRLFAWALCATFSHPRWAPCQEKQVRPKSLRFAWAFPFFVWLIDAGGVWDGTEGDSRALDQADQRFLVSGLPVYLNIYTQIYK